MQKIRRISEIGDNHFVSRVLDTTFDKNIGSDGLRVLEKAYVESQNK